MRVNLAFDTENAYDDDGEAKVMLIQTAPIPVRKLDEVCVHMGEGCFDEFYAKWRTTNLNIFLHNMDWEWRQLFYWLCHKTILIETRNPKEFGEFTQVMTDMSAYYLEVGMGGGVTWRIYDTVKHYQAPLKKIGEELLKDDMFRDIMNREAPMGKESDIVDELHMVWWNHEKKDVYIHYAKVDAFIESLAVEKLAVNGRLGWQGLDGSKFTLSAASAGFKEAMMMHFRGCHTNEFGEKFGKRVPSEWEEKSTQWLNLKAGRWLQKALIEHFGKLTTDERMMVEKNLRGGFVFGATGVWKGRFWHVDYKSSYPYEYAFGMLPFGEMNEISVDEFCAEFKGFDFKPVKERFGERFFVKCSFDFKLKKNAMPLITGGLCDLIGHSNEKMREGTVTDKLFTEREWTLLHRLYDIENMCVLKVWKCKAERGFWKKEVEHFFNQKETTKGLERSLHKLDLNGAVHGKPMQRLLTAVRAHITSEGEKERVNAEEPDNDWTNPLVGFTAMADARVRLVSMCQAVQDFGYSVYMCDTDSMITDMHPDLLSVVLEMQGWHDWVKRAGELKGKPMSETLGRFEIETDEHGREDFDTLFCWGLKRYCEMSEGRYRKSAFAGMDKSFRKDTTDFEDRKTSVQKELLSKGEQTLIWTQKVKKWSGRCNLLVDCVKHAEAQNIWYNEEDVKWEVHNGRANAPVTNIGGAEAST